MSNAYISPAIHDLPNLIEAVFGAAQDEIAEVIEANWKGRVVELDVIDSRTYLNAIAVQDGPTTSGHTRTVVIEAPEASGYASAIKRGKGGNYDYVGQRVAEEGINRSDSQIGVALDRAGHKVQG